MLGVVVHGFDIAEALASSALRVPMRSSRRRSGMSRPTSVLEGRVAGLI